MSEEDRLMNPYLAKKREEYAAVQTAVEGIQTRAVDQGRDLNDEELRSIEGQAETAKKLHAEIQLLTEQANRSAAVAGMAVAEAKASNTAAKDRDPGHYRSVLEGGKFSFLSDQLRARTLGDRDALARLGEHNRALDSSDPLGNIPPNWMTNLFTEISQENAALARATSSFPLTDARAFTLPGQTASTVIAAQAAEGDALVDGDDYDSAGVAVTPTTLVGQETVSRQLLDGSNPAIDQIIMSDLARSYVADRENRIGAAIKAVGTALAVALTDFNDDTSSDYGYDLSVDAAMAVRKAHYQRPTSFVMDYDLFTAYMKLKDADGRPVLVVSSNNPVNAIGTGSVNADGFIAGVPVVVSAGMSGGGTDYFGAMIHGPQVQWFESPGMTFRFEEVLGPQEIKIGIWRYFAVSVRQSTRAVKNVEVDSLT